MSIIDRERSLNDMLRELGIDTLSEQIEQESLSEEHAENEEDTVRQITQLTSDEINTGRDDNIANIVNLIELTVNIFGEDSELLSLILAKLRERLVNHVKENYGELVAKLIDIVLRILSKYERR